MPATTLSPAVTDARTPIQSFLQAPWVPHAALGFVGLTFGAFALVVKWLLQETSAWELGLLRLMIPALLMMLAERVWIKTRLKSTADTFKLIGLGVVGMWFVQLVSVFGVEYTSTFHASLIMATIPLFTLALSLLLKLEPIALKKALGVLLGFSGVGLLLTLNPGRVAGLPSTFLLGDALILVNALAFAWFLIQNKPFVNRYPPFTVTAYCYSGALLAALLTTMIGPFFGAIMHGNPVPTLIQLGQRLAALTPHGWGWLMYLVFPASIMNYTLTNFALKRLSPATVSAYVFVQPVVAAVLGFLFLGEQFTLMMGFAGCCVAAGLWLVGQSSAKPRTQTP
ncbi:MAG: EamA family transporter [Vampirovibrionales bacterium]|nr:EamA family transporter [Vampirovibrionales bacterium]